MSATDESRRPRPAAAALVSLLVMMLGAAAAAQVGCKTDPARLLSGFDLP